MPFCLAYNKQACVVPPAFTVCFPYLHLLPRAFPLLLLLCSVHVKDRHQILKLALRVLEGFRVGLVVKMSTTPETVPFSETISQTAQEGLGVGGQVIANSEMPDIETSQPVCFYSFSRVHFSSFPRRVIKL
jgi:hypothetical protein